MKKRRKEVVQESAEARSVYCVVGAGNGGMAMAAHLGVMGFRVRLFNRTDEHLEGVRWHGGIKVEGEVEGFGPVELATSSMEEALEGVDIAMVVTPSTAHRGLASLMAPHLRDKQIVVLNPGRTGGALEFLKQIREDGLIGKPIIAEVQTFLYASRALSRYEAKIFRIKNEVPLAALPAHQTAEVLRRLEPAFPWFSPGGDVLSTSLENIGAVFHPALTILNGGWIEATHGDFDYYSDGITPSVALVLERIDAERLHVARLLGVRSVSSREWLYQSYDSHGDDLCEAIKNTEAYRGIRAPVNLQHRYIWEDVPMSLVPLSSLGKALGAPTPTIDLIIELASILHGRDYRAEGRTIESLGLAGLTVKEIRKLVDEEA
ncbi:MAG: NAD/NADP octopine/nopaline dehydrogenase family protein [Rectinemataceae bacterium]